MNKNVLQLSRTKDFGDDVTPKEVRFLQIVDREIGACEPVVDFPTSLVERVRALRDRIRQNLEAEAQEM